VTAPGLAAWRFCAGLILGGGLGLFYGFLRPPRAKHPHLCDFVFMVGFFLLWIFYGFGICYGDLRFAYSLTLPLGALLWESTGGKALRPLIFRFWRIIYRFFRLLCRPLEYFLKKVRLFLKFLFSSGKKWFTIKKQNKRKGELDDGTEEALFQKIPVCIPVQPSGAEIRPAHHHSGGSGKPIRFGRLFSKATRRF
jgi:hypothetical protein